MKQKLQKFMFIPFLLMMFGMTLNLSAQEVIEFEGEAFDIVDPADDPADRVDSVWVVVDDAEASGGKYIKPLLGGKNAKYRGYNFTTTSLVDTTFYIWIKTRPRYGEDIWGGKVWLNWDIDQSIVDQGGKAFPDQAQTFMQYKNELFTPDTLKWQWWLAVDAQSGKKIFSADLAAGDHTFYLRARDDNMNIDVIRLTNDLDWRPEITYEIEAETGDIYGQGVSEDASLYEEYRGSVDIVEPLVIAEYTGASLDSVISAPDGSGTISNTNLFSGNADIKIRVERAPGDYYLWLYVDLPSESSNSYWIGTGDEQLMPPSWEGDVTSGLEWRRVTNNDETPKIFPMELGQWHGGQIVRIKQQEEGTKLDRIIITNNVDFHPDSVETSVKDEENSIIPKKFSVAQNYPNPFNPTTNIRFTLSEGGVVSLKVYNILGEVVATLLNEKRSAGEHKVLFDASHLTTGMYIYRIQSGNFVATKKMMLVK